MTVMNISSTNLLNSYVFCASFNIKYIKIKSRIRKVYAFFHKKKFTVIKCNIILQTPCNYLFACWENCSCFYFRLLTFFKITISQINHPGLLTECQSVLIQIKTDILSVGLHLGSNSLQNGRRQSSQLAWKEL